ncbi:MAG: phosphoglucosamine mutase [Synechococcaceae bacterium WB6_3B_236]|nr:phosphoglucosamine mutase [Synechococcaceae bacterium WB6_3B_236]
MADLAAHPVGAPLGGGGISFGTDGIRGRVGPLMTPALALQVGYWSGQVLAGDGPVLIGMDSRSSGPMLSAALAAGLTAAGREVWELGLCPTPAVARLVRRLGAAGGVMVSASHNPPEDNGIKLFAASGAKLSRGQQEAIEAGLRGEVRPALSRCGAIYQRNELLSQYRELLEQGLAGRRLDGRRIVLDLCWGSATALSAGLFRDLGAEISVLHGEADGSAINVGCGSTHLEPLRQAVLEQGAELGFAFDGDADRVLAVDGQGRLVDGDHILYLWGSALAALGQLPEQRLVATVMSNLGFERAWLARGGLLERTAVGDQFVHGAMEASGAALGGEQSGHILCAHHDLCGDGLLTALQLVALLEPGETLADRLDHSFSSYPQRLKNVRVPDKARRKGWQQCGPLVEAIAAAETAMGGEGRVLVRASGTEPLLRVMVEASSQAAVDHWTEQLSAIADRELNG